MAIKCKHDWHVVGTSYRCDTPGDLMDGTEDYYEVAVKVCSKCGKKETIKTW